MSYLYDSEVPAGYQDADIEMAELEAMGNLISRLNKSGKYTHESTVGLDADGVAHYKLAEGLKPGQSICFNCEAVFDSAEEHQRARALVINGFLNDHADR